LDLSLLRVGGSAEPEEGKDEEDDDDEADEIDDGVHFGALPTRFRCNSKCVNRILVAMLLK
jgi:hypothetical protein